MSLIASQQLQACTPTNENQPKQIKQKKIVMFLGFTQ